MWFFRKQNRDAELMDLVEQAQKQTRYALDGWLAAVATATEASEQRDQAIGMVRHLLAERAAK